MPTALRMIGYGIALFIAIGIALVALEANESNEVVNGWLEGCRFLVAPFDDIFDLKRGQEHAQIAINWGIAAVVYVVVASVLARIVARAGKVRT